MQIITGNHFFQEFSGRNNVRDENGHHTKSNKHHNSLATTQNQNQSISLQYQEKTESIQYSQTNQSDDDVNADVSFKAESTSFSLSFNGGLEDSNRLLYNSISQKLEGFQTKSDGTQFSFEYSSNSTEFSFGSAEDTANLLISKITQIALSFGSFGSNDDEEDLHHDEAASGTVVNNDTITPTSTTPDTQTTPVADTSETEGVIIPTAPTTVAPVTTQTATPETHVADIQTAVNSGFQESTNAIQQYGGFTSDISNAFDAIRQRLDDLLNSLTQPTTTTINTNYFKYDSSSETSIQIKTNDGDIVNIDFSNSSHLEYFNGSIENGQLSANDTNYQNSSENNYSFSVEGDLDEGELAAIEKLVAGIQETTKSYSQNDISDAFSTISQIDFDTSELQAYQFESKTVEEFKAVSLYQQIASDETNETESTNPPMSSNIDLAIGSILDLLAKAEENNISEPITTISQFIEKFSQQQQLEASEEHVEATLPYEKQVETEGLNLVA